MRIIKEGDKIKEEFTFCTYCGTELGFYPFEAKPVTEKMIKKYNFPSDYLNAPYLNCPFCTDFLVFTNVKKTENDEVMDEA